MKASKVLYGAAIGQAVGAFTVTPLCGYLVGDGKPSLLAPVYSLLIAMVILIAAMCFRLSERRSERMKRRADVFYAGPQFDRFANARRQAHALGFPWIEPDGTFSWPEPTAEQVHEDLHARRLAAQPELVHVPGVGWTLRHRD